MLRVFDLFITKRVARTGDFFFFILFFLSVFTRIELWSEEVQEEVTERKTKRQKKEERYFFGPEFPGTRIAREKEKRSTKSPERGKERRLSTGWVLILESSACGGSGEKPGRARILHLQLRGGVRENGKCTKNQVVTAAKLFFYSRESWSFLKQEKRRLRSMLDTKREGLLLVIRVPPTRLGGKSRCVQEVVILSFFEQA